MQHTVDTDDAIESATRLILHVNSSINEGSGGNAEEKDREEGTLKLKDAALVEAVVTYMRGLARLQKRMRQRCRAFPCTWWAARLML